MENVNVVGRMGNTAGQGSLLKLMEQTRDVETKNFLGKLVVDAKKEGILDPNKLEEYLRKAIEEYSLGPYAPK